MNIFKKELKWNLKFFLIWLSVFLLWEWMYVPITGQFMGEISTFVTFLDKLPKALLKAFNMDAQMLTKPEGLFGSEGMSFLYILGAVFSATLAGNLFAKEYEQKTIEFLLIKPLSRISIFLQKFSVFFLFISISFAAFTVNLFLLFHIFIGPKIAFDYGILFAFGLYAYVVMAFFGSLSIFLSIMTQKSSINTTVSLALIIFMYFGASLAETFKVTSWIGWLSIFKFIPLMDTVKEGKIFWENSLLIFLISLAGVFLCAWIFNRKEIKFE
jgi:ABC-2 type transport system permease protein